MSTPASPRPSVTIERMVEWPDTDAAGHYHHSAVIRWVEAAEAVLHEQLGLPELFGTVPRVHYEVDYLERLWFRDRVTVTLEVADVGETSLRYDFQVERDGRPAARGKLVCVRTDAEGPASWDDDARRALTEA